MTLSANNFWEVRPTAGSDTNGGAFDNTGTGFATDLATTSGTSSTASVSSATYTFVAGDVGHWLYIQGGSGWTPGWYKISSVAGGAATLNAGIGQAILASNNSTNFTAGVGTSATLTGGTFSIDYTQANTAKVSVTDAVTNNTTTVTSATAAFTPAMVGNAIYLSGTGTTTGRYTITGYTSSSSITVDRATGSTGGTGVTLNLGGALATLVQAYSSSGVTGAVGGNVTWLQNTGSLSVTAGATLPAGSTSVGYTVLAGYNSLRSDLDQTSVFTNHPNVVSNNASIALITLPAYCQVRNLVLDAGAGATKGLIAINSSSTNIYVENCKATGAFSQRGFTSSNGTSIFNRCYATGIAGSQGAFYAVGGTGSLFLDCVAYANACQGFHGSGIIAINCISDGNTTANGHGFQATTNPMVLRNCVARNNAGDGAHIDSGVIYGFSGIFNSIFVSNGGYGINSVSSAPNWQGNTNAFYNNTSGPRSSGVPQGANDITLTGDPFTSPGAGGDWSLNNTAGAGAACRAAGFPGTFSGTSTTGFIDVGATQHQSAASSGGGGPNITIAHGGQLLLTE